MTSAESNIPVELAEDVEPPAQQGRAEGNDDRNASVWDRLETVLDTISEKLNPILVKEARQALKSRQFMTTFALLLTCGWAWSVIGVVVQREGVYYAEGGTFMLIGYYIVLALPLMLIVPFAAYRSLASEQEDGTFELLSISTLNSRQIVTGKLGSAILQMLVYYSALSPCIAFTYLLRGIDVITIGLILVYTFLVSLTLSAIGLLLATITRSRHWQVLISVVLIVALLAAGFFWSLLIIGFFIIGPKYYDQAVFWGINLALVTLLFTYLAMAILGAAARLSFATDNRSTPIRYAMLAQHILFLGWMSYFWYTERQEEVLVTTVLAAAANWIILGGLMSGESGFLSPRVRRRLPQTFLGRMFLTWYNPGSGTGYTFAVSNMLGAVVFVSLLAIAGDFTGHASSRSLYRFMAFCGVAFCYVTIYLGLNRLAMLALQRIATASMILSLLTVLLATAAGTICPTLLAWWVSDFSGPDYSLIQLPNWIWTLLESYNDFSGFWSRPPARLIGLPLEVILLFSGAVFLYFVNTLYTTREIDEVREQAPRRVLQDDAELHPAPEVQVGPSNPWDYPDEES